MKLDARFAKAFSEFNKQDDLRRLRFNQCVARTLRAWFAQFQPTPWVTGAADQDNTEGGPGGLGGLWWRVRRRRRRRPRLCLEANKDC